jgi:tRNA G18 (ribose-2'-O)-methylase SpoU
MFEQVRHRPPSPLSRPRDIILVCAPFRTKVNLSSIVRTAGCCGVRRLIACGDPKIDPAIARDGATEIPVEKHRSLTSVLRSLQKEDFAVIGLEQTTNSTSLHQFSFPRNTALVIGNERLGLTEEQLAYVDCCVEIPVWGRPYSYNVATATAMALYEYCKQYPQG